MLYFSKSNLEKNQKKVWAKRARNYNNLEWVNKKGILDSLVSICNPKKEDIILDVGCGTGKVICSLSPFVKECHGVDLSPEMLNFIEKKGYENIKLKVGDITNLNYHNESFDKVTARLVLHHIIGDGQLNKALSECYRVLKKGGQIIISEGVPPHKDLRKDYEDIFKLKEERLVFLPEDIENLLKQSGFKNIKTNIVKDKGMSIKNWLENDGTISEENKKKIYDMHKYSSDLFKKAYNLVDKKDDILIDVKIAIISAEK